MPTAPSATKVRLFDSTCQTPEVSAISGTVIVSWVIGVDRRTFKEESRGFTSYRSVVNYLEVLEKRPEQILKACAALWVACCPLPVSKLAFDKCALQVS